MAKQNGKLIALALVGACSLGLWTLGGALFGEDEAQGARDLINRPWIDHVPHDSKDMIGHLVVLEHPQGKFGATGRSSNWRHIIEVFKWQLRGDKLMLYFPQEDVRAGVSVRTWSCEGEAPAPFDLCLELTARNGRSLTLYSREDWEIQPHDVADSLEDIAEDEPALRGVFGDFEQDQIDLLEALELDEDSTKDWAERDWF